MLIKLQECTDSIQFKKILNNTLCTSHQCLKIKGLHMIIYT